MNSPFDVHPHGLLESPLIMLNEVAMDPFPVGLGAIPTNFINHVLTVSLESRARQCSSDEAGCFWCSSSPPSSYLRVVVRYQSWCKIPRDLSPKIPLLPLVMGSIAEEPLVKIPVIDISGYLAGDPEAKRQTALEVRDAYENQGFLQVIGHSVPPEVQERFLSAIASFFALPLSEKQKVSQENSKCYRGYERIGGQKLDELDTSATPDQKEGFSVRPERPLGRFLQGPNQWPETLPGFKEAYLDYFNAVHELSKNVFRLMALSLDLPEDHFDAFAADPDGESLEDEAIG